MRLTILMLICMSYVTFGQIPQVDSDGSNQFGLDLFLHLVNQNPESNVFISPYSVSNAMAMTYMGAEKETKEQLRLALNVSADKKSVSERFNRINQAITKKDNLNELTLANALWMQKDYSFLKDYKKSLDDSFGAKAERLSFSSKKDIAKSCKIVNSWVQRNTKNNIEFIISEDDLSINTKLIITSAIWFNGQWENSFDATKNQEMLFDNLNSSKSKAVFMHQQAEYKAIKSKEFSAIEIPYAGNEFVMVIIVPNNDYSNFERKLSMDYIQSINTQLKVSTVSLWLPKFTEDFQTKLKAPLKLLGVQNAFNQNANFSAMTGANDLFVDEVFHNANLKVSENGVVASAASAVVINRKSAVLPLEIKLDKPFFYFIRENNKGTILFMGRKVSFH